MPLWQLWLDMAKDSFGGAILIGEAHKRVAASRFYYAGFQAATAILHYRGGLQAPAPNGAAWEHWGHDKTPALLAEHLGRFLTDSEGRRLRSYLSEMYKLRLYSDYVGADFVTLVELERQRRRASYMVKLAEQICVAGRRVGKGR